MCKYSSQSNTRNHTTNNHRHEILSLTHQFERQSVRLLRQYILCEHQHEVEGEDSEDGLHHELEAKNLQGHHQQDAIDDDIGILQMESRSIVDNSRKTCHTSCHNLVRHQEYGKGYGVKKETKGYK